MAGFLPEFAVRPFAELALGMLGATGSPWGRTPRIRGRSWGSPRLDNPDHADIVFEKVTLWSFKGSRLAAQGTGDRLAYDREGAGDGSPARMPPCSPPSPATCQQVPRRSAPRAPGGAKMADASRSTSPSRGSTVRPSPSAPTTRATPAPHHRQAADRRAHRPAHASTAPRSRPTPHRGADFEGPVSGRRPGPPMTGALAGVTVALALGAPPRRRRRRRSSSAAAAGPDRSTRCTSPPTTSTVLTKENRPSGQGMFTWCALPRTTSLPSNPLPGMNTTASPVTHARAVKRPAPTKVDKVYCHGDVMVEQGDREAPAMMQSSTTSLASSP